MTANQKRLTTEQEEQKARIWQFVLENVNFFCDPEVSMAPGNWATGAGAAGSCTTDVMAEVN